MISQNLNTKHLDKKIKVNPQHYHTSFISKKSHLSGNTPFLNSSSSRLSFGDATMQSQPASGSKATIAPGCCNKVWSHLWRLEFLSAPVNVSPN